MKEDLVGGHAIPIAPVLVGQLNDVVGQTHFINTTLGDLALRESMLTEYAADAALDTPSS